MLAVVLLCDIVVFVLCIDGGMRSDVVAVSVTVFAIVFVVCCVVAVFFWFCCRG